MKQTHFTKPQSPGPSEGPKSNKPVAEIRIGMIRAAIWARPYEEGVSHNVTFNRIYRSGDEWRRTESFGRDDLLILAKVADQAHSWICEQQAAARSS